MQNLQSVQIRVLPQTYVYRCGCKLESQAAAQYHRRASKLVVLHLSLSRLSKLQERNATEAATSKSRHYLKAAVDMWGVSHCGRIEKCIPKVSVNNLATHGAIALSCLQCYVVCCHNNGQKIVLRHGSGTDLPLYIPVYTAGHSANPCKCWGSKTMAPHVEQLQ